MSDVLDLDSIKARRAGMSGYVDHNNEPHWDHVRGDLDALIAEVERMEGIVQVCEEMIDEALGLVRRHGASPLGPLEQAERFLSEQRPGDDAP